jgi:hypothetical protein
MQDNVIDVANLLGGLSAQPPTAIDEPHVSPFDHDMGEAHKQEYELEIFERISSQVATPTSSELTDIDDAIPRDQMDPAPESQLITTDTHFIDPVAPRVSYQVSSDGVVTIEEQIQAISPVIHQSSPSPCVTTPSFERYMSQNNTPKLPGCPRVPPSLAFERIMGSKNYIPARILQTLENWHATHPGRTEHPCAIKKRAPSTWDNFKVFDEDADEHELSIFQISVKGPGRKTARYHILVLHSENGPDELVIFDQSRPKAARICKGKYGMYLLAWIEAEEEWEDQACAIKLWRTDKEEIIFTPQMFETSKRSSVSASTISSKALRAGLDINNTDNDDGKNDESSSPDIPLMYSRSQIANDKQAIKWAQKRNDKDESPTISGDHSHVLGSPFMFSGHQTKRAKHNPEEQDTMQAAIRFSTTQVQNRRSLIRFKLLSADKVQVRYFDTDDAKAFFKKVREFFNPTPAGLLCTYPGLDCVRYIGAGCVDEFNILLDGIRHSSVPAGEERVAVVNPSVSS